MGEQSSGVKLAEKPGLVGFAVPFGAIKRRKALSHVGRELFRAIVLCRDRGAHEVTRAEFILIPSRAKYPRLRPRCMKIYDILVRLFGRPFAREIYSMHVI